MIIRTQHLLALYKADDESRSAEQTRQVWADVNALGDRLTEAGAFVFQGGPVDSYYLFHAARADLLRRLGRTTEAAAAYATARSLTANPAEQAFLDDQRATVSQPKWLS